MMKSRLGRVPSAEEGSINEGWNGKVKTAGHIRPCIDKMETRETICRVVLHANPKGSSSTFKEGHLHEGIFLH